MGLVNFKVYLWIAIVCIAIVVSVIGSIWFTINKFHYAPIAALQKSIVDKDKKHNDLIKVYETNLNEIYGKLFMCEQNSTNSKIEGIIEGLGGEDEADIIIDFSNITY